MKWICDKCKCEIRKGDQGRFRWWELAQTIAGQYHNTISDFEILCRHCHAFSLNWREIDESVECWHYVDDLNTWIDDWSNTKQQPRFTIVDKEHFIEAVNRVANGD